MTETIRCSRCEQHLDPEAFSPTQRTHGAYCRVCAIEYWNHYASVKGKMALHGPKVPKEPPVNSKYTLRRDCKVCGIQIARPARSLCGSRECALENGRRQMRRVRQEKPPRFVKAKQASNRRRRARKAGVLSVPYDPIDIANRDGWRCHLCGRKIKRSQLTMDHLVPISAMGDDAPWNVRAAHGSCNSRKGARPAGEQLMLIG